jgi:hypothetical protein
MAQYSVLNFAVYLAFLGWIRLYILARIGVIGLKLGFTFKNIAANFAPGTNRPYFKSGNHETETVVK